MRLKVASRKSDLARWQAVQVARALEQLPNKPSVEYIFKSSLGDQNLDLPLASMGSKGVFTEDFYEDLVSGRCDLVVHSWKDLPTEPRADTRLAMTLPRADMRDVLLISEAVWARACETHELLVFTSSPRRVYNLSAALPKLLPTAVALTFSPVRGNVRTRLRKMHEQGAALVLAKAGLDRLLVAEKEGFLGEADAIRPLLRDCRFLVLPLSLNPPAPAQGALAVEVARENEQVLDLCTQLNHADTFESVAEEREILRGYGGGCHQKIGVGILNRDYGRVLALRGLTEQGEVLSRWDVTNPTPWTRAARAEQIFPLNPKENSWFHREPVVRPELAHLPGLFIARAEALPEGYVPPPEQKIWTAGVQTWMRLAALGIFVSGCQDGLGETEPMGLEALAGSVTWTKLTHDLAASSPNAIATYKLRAKTESVPDLRGKTHFFWMSRTSFERARELYPREIAEGHHACGPGATYAYLRDLKNLKHPVKVFIGLDQFLRESLPA